MKDEFKAFDEAMKVLDSNKVPERERIMTVNMTISEDCKFITSEDFAKGIKNAIKEVDLKHKHIY